MVNKDPKDPNDLVMNLQLFADQPAVADMSADELVDELTDIPMVDSDDPSTLEDLDPDVPAGDDPPAADPQQPAADDPYSVLQRSEGDLDGLPYDTVRDLGDGYKNIQTLASKLQEQNKALQDQIAGLRAAPQDGLDDIIDTNEFNGMTAKQIEEVVNKTMTKQFADFKKEQTEVRTEEATQSRIDRNYNDALGFEGFQENVSKVHGIIQHFPHMAENQSIGNPYRLALEMAKNPELMRVYNKFPELLESRGGGIRAAQSLMLSNNSQQNIDEAQIKAKTDGEKKQIDQMNAAVATPSAGGEEGGEKPIKDMTKEDVFKAVGYEPGEEY